MKESNRYPDADDIPADKFNSGDFYTLVYANTTSDYGGSGSYTLLGNFLTEAKAEAEANEHAAETGNPRENYKIVKANSMYENLPKSGTMKIKNSKHWYFR